MKLAERIKHDYFMKNRFAEYKSILMRAKSFGFQFNRVCDFGLEEYINTDKTVILRHDIDTDVHIARKMFEIEKELSIKSTYYFRLSTMNLKFIKELIAYGNEVSYHFEEISTYAYDHNISSRKELETNFDKIQDIFVKNLNMFRTKTKCKCETVASHGDFINRKIGIINNEFLNDKFKNECGIRLEAYDKPLLDSTKYCSDGNTEFLHLVSFDDNKRYYMLVHPRTWASQPFVRFCADLKRCLMGIKYKIGEKK